MGKWKEIRVGDFLKRVKYPIDLTPDEEYQLVTIKMHHNGVIPRQKKLGAKIKSKMFQVHSGQFILSGIDARNGAFGVIPDELEGAIVSNDFWYFELDESIIKRDFFFWLSSTPFFLDACIKSSEGTTNRRRLQKERFFNFAFYLPENISDQESLLNRLKTQDLFHQEISEEITHQQELLQKLRQSILQDAVQGKLTKQWRKDNPDVEPASELLKRINTEKEKLIKEKKIRKTKALPPITEDEIPFDLPGGWEWCYLQEITSLVTDGKHGDCQNQSNSGYYFLSAKDIQNGELLYDNARQILPKDFQEVHNRTNLEPGDICMVNTGATIGKSAIASNHPYTPKTTFQKSVAVIKLFRKHVSSKYIRELLVCETSKLLATSWGSAINNLLLGDLRKQLVPLPPQEEQKTIAVKVEELFIFCDQLEEQINQSKSNSELLMQTVLKEAFEN